MVRLVPDIDYVERLEKLRDSYVTAYPRQRLSVIRQRLEDHHFGPNRLVTSVSAVEAYARFSLPHPYGHLSGPSLQLVDSSLAC